MRNKDIIARATTCAVIVCLFIFIGRYRHIPDSIYEDVDPRSNPLSVFSTNLLPLTSSAPPATSSTIKDKSSSLSLQLTSTKHKPDLPTLQTMDGFPKVGLIRPHPRKFCCDLISGIVLETICPSYDSKTKLVPILGRDLMNCTCQDFLICRLVVLTAMSSNHFHEAEDMIASVQTNLPYTQLIIYDLGLRIEDKSQLSKFCNAEVRQLNFSKYPRYVKNLETYAWKPMIISEIIREYEVVIYGDASVRIHQPAAERLPLLLLEFPFVSGPSHPFPITALTHDSTLSFLGLNMPRVIAVKEMNGTVQATFCAWFTSVIREKWMKRWLDCALHEECIAPPGTSPLGCKIHSLKRDDGAYIGCHRFDQSALNVILYQEFGRKRWEQLFHPKLNGGPQDYWDIERTITHSYKVKTCI